MELMVLEFFAALFLLLSILRPFFKGLWNLAGIAVLPPLALAILVCIFPVYGFRPECVPLLVFAVIYNIVQFGGFAALFLSLKNDDYRDRGPVFTVCCLAVFGFAAWIAWHFAPPMDFDLLQSEESANAVALYDRGRGAELWARIYPPADNAAAGSEKSAPFIMMIPPAAASLPAIDAVCADLARRGFAVLAYSRPGFDSPAVASDGGLKRIFLHWGRINALLRGRTDAAANEAGRALEEGRLRDIEFILEEISSNAKLIEALGPADRKNAVLAGWGAGGAALALLAADEKFAARYGEGGPVQVRGIAAVESPILSCYEAEALPPLPDSGGNPVLGFLYGARQFAVGLLPRKVTGLGAIRRIRIPALFIASDRVKDEKNERYETLRRIASLSPSLAKIESLPGMGPLDYSDAPRLYPLWSFLFRGLPEGENAAARDKDDYPKITAELIADFSKSVNIGTLEE
jgi:dienelactone hydrolase